MIGSLEKQIYILEASNFKLQRVRDDDAKNISAVGDQLQRTVSDITRDLDFTRLSIRDLERKLEEAAALNKSLEKQIQVLNMSNLQLHNEVKNLREEKDTIIKDRIAVQKALENEIQRRTCGDIAESRYKCELLEVEFTTAEKKIVQHQEQMAELEAVFSGANIGVRDNGRPKKAI
jgi:chromosome segregation ATPase